MTHAVTGPESPGGPNSEPPEAGSPEDYQEPRIRPHLVLAVGTLIAVFFTITGLVLYFRPFSHTATVAEPSLNVFAAGPMEIFERGSITYFEEEHFYLVRFNDGAFLAVYDLSPLAQQRVAAGDEEQLDCRTTVREDDEMAGWLNESGSSRGLAGVGFFDECEGVAWNAEGRRVWGAESGDLDRFPVGVREEIVRIDLVARRCAEGSPCIETQ